MIRNKTLSSPSSSPPSRSPNSYGESVHSGSLECSSTSTAASTSVAVASATHVYITHNPDTPINTNTSTVNSSAEDLVCTCPHCDRTFTSHIGHLRLHRTETCEPVPGAPTYTRRIRIHCSYFPDIFMHRMGLFGHIRIHESGADHNPDTPSTPTMPSPDKHSSAQLAHRHQPHHAQYILPTHHAQPNPHPVALHAHYHHLG
ncbi:hypothetical protein SprV_0602161200 [Sparganum proliferum]